MHTTINIFLPFLTVAMASENRRMIGDTGDEFVNQCIDHVAIVLKNIKKRMRSCRCEKYSSILCVATNQNNRWPADSSCIRSTEEQRHFQPRIQRGQMYAKLGIIHTNRLQGCGNA
jgi:hypothetical protein